MKFLIYFLALVPIHLTFASTIIWVGTAPTGSKTSWSNSGNWSTGTVPNGSADVQISDLATAPNQPTVNIAASINSLTVGTTSVLTVASGKSLTVGSIFTNTGDITIDSTATFSTPDYYQTSGLTTLDGELSTSLINIEGGTLTGTGKLSGSILNLTGGVLQPGDTSPGTIQLGTCMSCGFYSQTSGGTLDIAIASALTYSQVIVGLGANLEGTLNVSLMGYTPQIGDTFEILESDAFGAPGGYGLTGNFATINLPSLGGGMKFVESETSTDVFLTVEAVPEPSTSILLSSVMLAFAFILKRHSHVRRG